MEPDFTQLYSQLNLPPDCSLEEFKRAYRRRISELHPDRRDSMSAPGLETQNLLRELISLYAAAIRFNQRHGRLPGGAVHSTAMPRPSTVFRQHSYIPPPPPPSRQPVRHGRAISILLIALLLTLLLSWYWSTPTEQEESTLAPEYTGPVTTVTVARSQLEVGMDKDTVLVIQGEPLHKYDTEWDYGPSWLRFEQGHLIDWYSSPLYRLRTTTSTAQPKAATSPLQNPPQPIKPSTK